MIVFSLKSKARNFKVKKNRRVYESKFLFTPGHAWFAYFETKFKIIENGEGGDQLLSEGFEEK